MCTETPTRVRLLGMGVDAVDMNGALDFVEHYVKAGTCPGYILAVNPEKAYSQRKNIALLSFFDDAALLIPDGIGVVLAMRFLFRMSVSRVPGADLMQQICAKAPQAGYRLFIYGAKEEVSKTAVEELRRRHPGIQIVGRANGYVKPEEMEALVEQINDSGADILLLALGSPRQEQWIQQYLPRLKVKICQGIGGTLDTIAGTVKRAPRAFQAVGLEWFYRTLRQPTRWRRDIDKLLFVPAVICDRLAGRPTTAVVERADAVAEGVHA